MITGKKVKKRGLSAFYMLFKIQQFYKNLDLVRKTPLKNLDLVLKTLFGVLV